MSETSSEAQLWCSVINQAIIDATQPLSIKDAKVRNEQIRAREWFERNGKDFRQVCYLAGIEGERIRAKAMELIAATRLLDPPYTPPVRKQRVWVKRTDTPRVVETSPGSTNDRSSSLAQERSQMDFS